MTGPAHQPDRSGAEGKPLDLDQAAERQHDIVTRAQCLTSGMMPGQIRWFCRSRRWQTVHPGVYARHTGPLDWTARAAAALLSCGRGAVLARRSAARVLHLVDEDPHVIDIEVPAARRVVAPQGARVRRVRGLEARMSRSPVWPPTTTVEDTVLDLAAAGNATEAEAWVARACQRRLTTPKRIAAALLRREKYPWRDLMTVAFEDVADGAESIAEMRYLRRVERAHGLPAATRQLRTVRGGRRRRDDNAYVEQKLLVEVDGQLGHVGDGALSDRRRDKAAAVDGWLTLRLGWQDVSVDTCEAAGDVGEVLTSRGWTGQLRRCGRACRVVGEGGRDIRGTSVAS